MRGMAMMARQPVWIVSQKSEQFWEQRIGIQVASAVGTPGKSFLHRAAFPFVNVC